MTQRALILIKAFWFYGRFSEAMSFSKFATLVSKVTIDVPQISIVWLPQVKCLLLLWKTKTACIKRSIHYVTLQCYNPGEATQRNSSRPQLWLFIEKKQILKMTLPQKNGSRIKTPSSKLLILVSFCWKKKILRINALTNLIESLISLKLEIIGVAFFLGHPVYHKDLMVTVQ